jgi:exopolysaccharide biosynthesis polyprenyl glycosylphosphotransferase
MLARSSRLNQVSLQVMDGLVAVLALIAAFVLREYLAPALSVHLPDVFKRDLGQIQPFRDYLIFVPVSMVVLPLVLARRGFYRIHPDHDRMQTGASILEACMVLFLVHISLQFFLKLDLSRLVFIFCIPAGFFGIYGRVLLYHRLVSGQRSAGVRAAISTLIIHSRSQSKRWVREIQSNPQFGFRVTRESAVGTFDRNQFVAWLHEDAAGLVIFDVGSTELPQISELIQACEEEGIETWLAADMIETRLARARIDSFRGHPVLVFQTRPERTLQHMAKEILDRVGSFGLLCVLWPVFLVIALGIRWTSPGPIFFRQQRSGRFGRPFTMYKFRTMFEDAEQRRAELLHKNEMSGPVFKVADDPRVTPFGAFLRRTSLDELPQLINVLMGDMSLVGPRPLPTYETHAITANAQRRRLSVKPGLTCLWQIRGRNEVSSFDEWVRLDLEYIDRWSFWLDLKILILTLPVVLLCRGAR